MRPPSKIKGAWIWSEVMPQLVPEINFNNLLELGTIVKHKGRTELYRYLRASLRKIQWTKISGYKAIAIERDIRARAKPNTLILDPLGVTDHSLSITDCLIHTKSALDSMAIFLNELLGLGFEKKGDRDLKHEKFRRKIIGKDHVIGEVIKKLKPWLLDLQRLRDQWIHRTTIRDIVLIGSSDVGPLPLPKRLHVDLKGPITPKNFLSTSDFVKYHYHQFVYLFNVVVERSIEIEVKDLDKIPVPNLDELKLWFLFPTRLAEKMTVQKITMSNITLSGYYKRLSEMFKGFESVELRVNGSHFDFLTNLAKGLGEYIRTYFGISTEIPNVRVIFVTKDRFNKLLNFKKFSKMIQNRKATTMQKGFLRPEGKEECYFIAIQKSRLTRTKRYLIRYLRQSQNTSEIILRSLIHETIHIYEEITSKKFLTYNKTLVTKDEINIYDKFQKEHPEYFTKQSNKNLLKTLEKIPNN